MDRHTISISGSSPYPHERLGMQYAVCQSVLVLCLGPDPLASYKATISRWIYPDLPRGQVISVAKGKKAISDYRKAIGLPAGVAEFSVFYCESAARLL
jgi:hypothetical protein